MKRIELKYFIPFALLVVATNSAMANANDLTSASTKSQLSQKSIGKAGSKDAKHRRGQFNHKLKGIPSKKDYRKYKVGFDTKSLSDFFETLKNKKLQIN